MAVIVVIHDVVVVRCLDDRVLDDPQRPCTELLVSSVLQV